MILIDANVFMYAAGKAHAHKAASWRFLQKAACGACDVAVDAEVLQEILYRYRSIGRWEDGRRVYDLVRTIVPAIVPIGAEVLDIARALLDRHAGLGARDALHAAVCLRLGVPDFCSFDTDFDGIQGVRRIEPAALL